MTLNGFKFEFRVLPDIKGDSERLIILEIKNNKYFLEYKKGNKIREVEITEKIDKFCKGLQMININEWNMQEFDEPWDWYPSYFWKLSIIADDIYVICKGKDNLPKNWIAFRTLLNEIGILDSKFPF